MNINKYYKYLFISSATGIGDKVENYTKKQPHLYALPYGTDINMEKVNK